MANRKYSKSTIIAIAGYAVNISITEIYSNLSKFKTNYTYDQLLHIIQLSIGTKENLSDVTFRETDEVKILLHFNWILNDFGQTIKAINGTQIISDSEYQKAEKLVILFTYKFLRSKVNFEPYDIFKDLDKFLLGIIELFYTITKLSIKGSYDIYKKEPDFSVGYEERIDGLLAKDLSSILMKDLCKDLIKIYTSN